MRERLQTRKLSHGTMTWWEYGGAQLCEQQMAGSEPPRLALTNVPFVINESSVDPAKRQRRASCSGKAREAEFR